MWCPTFLTFFTKIIFFNLTATFLSVLFLHVNQAIPINPHTENINFTFLVVSCQSEGPEFKLIFSRGLCTGFPHLSKYMQVMLKGNVIPVAINMSG